MASVIPGFEYDIFISYRHNDNLDGWVTDFVQNLEKELRSTLKETLTIYFDKNPHDGLLETHDVDDSLKEKLKCLIFIPIISQTYCDPKSFAWKNEFLVFKNQASEDQFGLKLKLGNGNVANRILPVRIHDLDADDKTLLENEIGPLRAIDFIFKSSGVNRPLRAMEDHPQDNVNRTFYRDQINKVANAVKEIITAIKNPAPITTTYQQPAYADASAGRPTTKPTRNRKPIFITLAVLLIATASYFIYQQLKSNNQQPPLDKSVAVLPFDDMSPNHDQEYFGDGMAEEIINVLAQSEDLRVIGRTSSFQFKGKNEDLRTIGKILGVSTVLEGSVRKSENLIRVTAQLIKTEDGTHLWSKTFDRKPADIFSIQDEIASAIASALKATLSPNLTSEKKEVWNDEARKLYQSGRFYFDRNSEGDGSRAGDFFQQSLKSDSTHAIVWAYYATMYFGIDNVSFERFNRKALQLDSLNSDALVNEAVNSRNRFDHKTAKRIIDKAFFLYPKDARVLRNLCNIYTSLGLLDQALVFGKMAIASDPLQARAYDNLNATYYFMKQYDSSNRVGRKLIEVSPNYIGLRSYFATNYFMMGQYDSVRLDMNSSVAEKAFYECAISFAKGDKKTSDEKIALYKLNIKFGNANYSLALIHCFRKEYDLAVDYIEKSYIAREGSLSSNIKVEPALDPIRNHPRFIAILKKFD